jgi:hypothetical protein
MRSRLLGGALIVSTVIVIVNGIRTAGMGPGFDPLTHAVYFLWGIGGICGVLGLLRTNAFGSSPIARTLGSLPLLGFASFVLADGGYLLGLFDGTEPLYNTLIGMAWGGTLVGMLVAGIVTIAAGKWTGWQRFAPLATVVMLPVAFGFGVLIGNQNTGGWLGFAGFVLLGAVIATSEPVPALEPGHVLT